MRAISSSSVETITRSNSPDFSAAEIDRAIMGTPQNSRTFLRGILLLPPRAGIIAVLIGSALMALPSIPLLGEN